MAGGDLDDRRGKAGRGVIRQQGSAVLAALAVHCTKAIFFPHFEGSPF
jgi:hypothetical protein